MKLHVPLFSGTLFSGFGLHYDGSSLGENKYVGGTLQWFRWRLIVQMKVHGSDEGRWPSQVDQWCSGPPTFTSINRDVVEGSWSRSRPNVHMNTCGLKEVPQPRPRWRLWSKWRSMDLISGPGDSPRSTLLLVQIEISGPDIWLWSKFRHEALANGPNERPRWQSLV